ncbi:protein C2-DOMAIN ABA-RELATED 7-like [Mangifera indica]|uniref:protein C2-DOMAIN ABA-RELATED 7-like n=1 Tax=Mangifera indica TaxID=29780 RepID=UPI001CFB41C7|nr:protein C2-DOMAIN ABA-RELATED 7-like [Mangifera indica]XP_044494710.1 protein C2-DOMAIN ABA-RELATED 7-like [Mangifera indica]
MSRSIESMLGLLKIRVKRGIDLVVSDTFSSDPYVVVTQGKQKLKTKVVSNNCNPVWNEDLTLPIRDPSIPVQLTVYDKDTFSVDDEMGYANIDIKPYMDCIKMGLENLPNGCTIKKLQPTKENCLLEESGIIWNNGKITQDMALKLQNVASGVVEIRLEWLDV